MTTIDSKHSLTSIVPTIKDTYDYLTKIIIIGSSGTGKSCILHRFLKKDFNVLTSQTIGVEFSSKIIEIEDDYKIKLQLWDTAGQERFRSLTRSYYRGSAGVILCYDISRKSTLLELDDYLMDVQALTTNPSIVIVGNKLDLPLEEHKIDDFDVDQLINKYEIQFNKKIKHLKVSAKSGDNIDDIFKSLAISIIKRVEIGEIDVDNQNYGVQYGDRDLFNGNYNNNGNGWDDDTLNSSKFNTIRSKHHPGRYIRRKKTTLSLIDRTLEDKNTCWC